jgi:hypothetical protein
MGNAAHSIRICNQIALHGFQGADPDLYPCFLSHGPAKADSLIGVSFILLSDVGKLIRLQIDDDFREVSKREQNYFKTNMKRSVA